MSKDERVLEREKNKLGESAELIIKKNLEKIKRLKNPNAEVTNQEIKMYLQNSAKHPFSLETGKRRQENGKKDTVIQRNESLGSQSEDSQSSRPQDRSGSDMQEEEKSSLKERKSKSSLSKIN